MNRRELVLNTAMEAALTSALLFGVATIVRTFSEPSVISPVSLDTRLRTALTGACVALLLAGLVLSPLGKRTGGHMNPAITVAMSCWGVFPRGFVIPYGVAQLLGSLLGVLMARLAWGPAIAARPVCYAVVQPAPGWTSLQLFAAETLGTTIVVLLVGSCLSDQRLRRYAAWITGAAVGSCIALLGNTSGPSFNPARQFGPAIASGELHFFWVYISAPMFGALIAVRLHGYFQSSRLLTHRLSGAV